MTDSKTKVITRLIILDAVKKAVPRIWGGIDDDFVKQETEKIDSELNQLIKKINNGYQRNKQRNSKGINPRR